MSETDQTLGAAVRCVVALPSPTRGAPILAPLPFWSDGAALWMTAPAASLDGGWLEGDQACAAFVPCVGDGDPGLAVEATLRVYSLADPLRLLLHAPSVSAAMAALAAKQAPVTAARAALAAKQAPVTVAAVRAAPRTVGASAERVVLRAYIDRLRAARFPAAGPGVVPALPSVVPPDARRAVAGIRRVVVGYQAEGRPQVAPATWSAGFALTLPAGTTVASGSPVTVAVTAGGATAQPKATAVVLTGRLAPDGRLIPQEVSWWRGTERFDADVPAVTAGGVELPE